MRSYCSCSPASLSLSGRVQPDSRKSDRARHRSRRSHQIRLVSDRLRDASRGVLGSKSSPAAPCGRGVAFSGFEAHRLKRVFLRHSRHERVTTNPILVGGLDPNEVSERHGKPSGPMDAAWLEVLVERVANPGWPCDEALPKNTSTAGGSPRPKTGPEATIWARRHRGRRVDQWPSRRSRPDAWDLSVAGGSTKGGRSAPCRRARYESV